MGAGTVALLPPPRYDVAAASASNRLRMAAGVAAVVRSVGTAGAAAMTGDLPCCCFCLFCASNVGEVNQ